MDEKRKWTAEQLEIFETLRSTEEAAADPALAPTMEALNQDPELAERLERILTWDDRVSKAMRDVPVPPGLAEQILHNLDVSSDKPQPAPKSPQSRRNARRWLALATCLTVAGVVLVVVSLSQSLPTMSPDSLRSVARDRFVGEQGSDPTGTILAQDAPPDRFRYSADLRDIAGTRWRTVPPFDRAKTYAYDIPLGPTQKATLYVVRCRPDSPLPLRPPRIPQLRTQGLAITAWQGDGVVYVAVVVRSGRFSADELYNELLKSPARPLT